jgi:hypothetical protein
LAVCTIGHGLAMARGLNARHAVKPNFRTAFQNTAVKQGNRGLAAI